MKDPLIIYTFTNFITDEELNGNKKLKTHTIFPICMN